MKASAKRNAVRWLHVGVGSFIAAYIYSPLGQIPAFQLATKAFVIPLTILSGIWLWKGHLLKRNLKKSTRMGMVLIVATGATLLCLMSFSSGDSKTLTLKINDVKRSGEIYVSFCTNASEWSENGTYHFQYAIPAKGINTYVINTIPHGTYAVAIYQDLNGNGKLDENMFGIPNEPFAFSNNVVPRFSAPKFDDCKFEFSKADQVLSINLLD
jgi:uncharacterized protein (DUF2141 family)